MKKVSFGILIMLAVFAHQSSAQGSFDPSLYSSDFGKPEIDRTEAFITQTGSANAATIDQHVDPLGTGHYAQIDQTGVSNRITVDQTGSANRVRSEQSGSFNSAALEQSGSGNSLALTQIGNGNMFQMTQIGNSQIVAEQIGDNNVIDAPQIGVGGTGTLLEIGNNNSIIVAPGYAGPALQSVEIRGDGQHWVVQ